MFTQQLQRLGLEQHLAYQGKEYQERMAKDLRSLVFRYIEGNLMDIHGAPIADGPAVKRFRDTVNEIGGKRQFIKEQSPDRAWATDIELTLLAELLQVTFVVEFPETKNNKKSVSVLSAVQTPNQPVIALANTNNTHWDAVLMNGQIDKATLHDGNCGYNAFAKSIAECCGQPQINKIPVENSLEIEVKQNQDSRYTREIEKYHEETAQFTAVHDKLKITDPKKYTETMTQINSDYQYALRIALADLPGAQGRASKASVVPFSILKPKPEVNALKQSNSVDPSIHRGLTK